MMTYSLDKGRWYVQLLTGLYLFCDSKHGRFSLDIYSFKLTGEDVGGLNPLLPMPISAVC